MISSKNLAQALYKLSTESVPTEKLMLALYNYLEKHHLLALLPATLKHLERLQKNNLKFNSLKVISSLPIDDEILTEIKTLLTVNKSALIEKLDDRELIGGFVATYQGFIYDASLKNQLNLLKSKLIEN